MPRYRDPQLQVGENYSDLCNLRPNVLKSSCLNTHVFPNDVIRSVNKTFLETRLHSCLAVKGLKTRPEIYTPFVESRRSTI